MDALRQKAKQVFEYLLAVKNLSMPVERDMSKYEPTWWVDDLLNIEGCYLGGTGRNNHAWIEIHKQTIPTPPVIPQILDGWVEGKWSSPEKIPTFKHKIIKQDGEEIAFEDSEDRVHAWVKWIKLWNDWAEVALPKTKIQNLYGQLFALNQRFQREEEAIELAWGHGLLVWNYKGQKIYRPMFVTRLELLFDAEKGIFEAVPTEKGTIMETDMLNNLDIPIERIASIERNINEEDIDPRDDELVRPIFKEIAHTLNPDGRAEFKNILRSQIQFYETPVVYKSSMFFVRNRATRQWQLELKNIIEAIEEGFPIPGTITSLITNKIEDVIASHLEGIDDKEEWKNIGEEILFPLEANNEQKEIVKRLASNFGVVVQGPPGTGKSHTIANLICHLLAHGKRVLVTSHTERALKVLADKIPLEIRHLCVNVAGGDTQSLKEVEESIRMLSENLSSIDVQQIRKEIECHKKELAEVRDKIAKLRYQLKQAAIKEHSNVIFEGKEMRPMDIAIWVKENEKYNWIPDNISWETEPLSDEEMMRLFALSGILSKADLEALSLSLPRLEKLPPPAEFSSIICSWTEEEKKTFDCKPAIAGWQNINDASIDVEMLLNQINNVIESLEQFSEPWLQKILEDITKGGLQRENWETLVKDSREAIDIIVQLNRELAQYNIDLPTDKSYSELKDDITAIKQHLFSNKKIGWMFTTITGRKYNYLLQNCKINNCIIRSIEDTDILLKHIEKQANIQLMVNKWNAFVEDVEGETLKSDQPRLLAIIDRYLNILETALNWGTATEPLKNAAGKYCIKGIQSWTEKSFLIKIKAGLEAIAQQRKFSQKTLKIETLKDYLKEGATSPKAHGTWNGLLEAIEKRNSTLWDSNIKELQRLCGLEPLKEELNKLGDLLRGVAPRWTEKILQDGGKGNALELPSDWKEAWKWSRFNSWLNDLYSEYKPEELQHQIDLETRREKRILEQIIADSTWMKQLERVTEPQKRSLYAWMATIRKIGKGTGKYADKHRKDAKKEMEICRGAIPVWIMPIHRVIENLRISKDLFDVVIIDESSQSDLFALCVFFRAKKAVIVGDDKQISPESVGTDQSAINELIYRYLTDIPQSHKFDMQTSIYDTALRIFPGHIMLKEHFRCVPEIIQFSNDLCYGGTIEPLRFPKPAEQLAFPIKAVRVEEGRREENTVAINVPEAKAIVKAIVDCCNDKVYNGRTMGVISLQGFHQAKLIEELLREELGEREMHQRKLICGDAYSFQGDERSVMFLSMVTAKNVAFRALTSGTDEKRFNVAASRAKDQVWLFHSVDLDDLNPNCLRARLLGYFLNPKRVTLEESKVQHLFDSDFERDVYRLITSRGYSVRPQVQVGRYKKRIDLVVEGLRNRLAVECDGDRWHGPEQWEADQERQMLLERVGWKFWRVRGSAFYRDPDAAMRPLWIKLKEMGIEPEKLEIIKKAESK